MSNISFPLVSIIIPSYNHEKYIKEAVDSALKQTYKNIEVIVIDDGSKDKSIEILKKYESKIHLICQENAGAHNAINRGLSIAKGDFLTILNSDDVYDKDRISVFVDYMLENPDVDLLCSYIQVIDSHSRKLGVKKAWNNMEPWPIQNKQASFAATNDFNKNLLMSNFISTTSNMLFRRRLFENIGGMRNLRFAHDWDFALRASYNSKCYLIEKPLISYRIHSNNTISTNRKHMLFEICWVVASNIYNYLGNTLFETNEKMSFEQVFESFNFQGNDKLFWVLLCYFLTGKKKGEANIDELLLEDKDLRESLFKYINE